MIEKIYDFVEKMIDVTIPETVFGVRAKGEPVKSPTFTTLYPEDQPAQFDWFQQFRVSCLHNVDQRVYLEAE